METKESDGALVGIIRPILHCNDLGEVEGVINRMSNCELLELIAAYLDETKGAKA